jgi:tetratricopeptide (TPR) repeat protein
MGCHFGYLLSEPRGFLPFGSEPGKRTFYFGANDRTIMGASFGGQGRRWLVALVILMTMAVYLDTLRYDFVWDDHRNILSSPVLSGSSPLLKSFSDFTHTTNFTYRPLMSVSFALDLSIWGKNPMGFHLTNVLLHATVTFLVFLLLLKISGSFRSALLAGAIFGVHPVHTEAVSWISGRSDILSTLFAIVSVLFSLKTHSSRGAPEWAWRFAAWAGFGLAILVKETAIVLPVLSLVWMWAVRKDRRRRILLFDFLPVLAIGILFLAFRSSFLLQHGSFQPVRTASMLTFVFGEYIRLLVFPSPLKALYTLPPATFADPLVLRSLAILLLWIGLGVYFIKRNPLIWMGVAWVVVSLQPTIALVVYKSVSPLAERLDYLPSVGFALVGSELLLAGSRWMKNRFSDRPSAAWVLPAILIVIFSLATVRSNAAWANEETLWKNTTIYSPGHPLAFYNLAVELQKQNRLGEAAVLYQKAIGLDPADSNSRYNLGIIYLDQGNYAAAAKYFKEALAINPRHSSAYTNLAMAYHFMGDDRLARKILEEAVRIDPSNAVAQNNLGNVLLTEGNVREAVEHYRKALALAPDYAEARTNLENAVRRAGTE